MSRTAPAASSGVIEMRTPNASSTSALPTFPEIARFPCLATLAPAPANTIAATVEMLNVPAPSPPVPTMSITSAPASTTTMCSRMARANPASSASRLPLHMQRHQERTDHRIAAPAFEQQGHRLISVSRSEIRTRSDAVQKGSKWHRIFYHRALPFVGE